MLYKVCRDCGEEYRPEIERCADCGGELDLASDDGSIPPPAQEDDEAPQATLTDGVPLTRVDRAASLRPLADALAGASIPFGVRSGPHGFELLVAPDDLDRAAELVAPHLGLSPVEGPPTHCPACEEALPAGTTECPSCGLGLGLAGEDEG